MTHGARSASLHKSMTADWAMRIQSRRWRNQVNHLLEKIKTSNQSAALFDVDGIVDIIRRLGGSREDRYLSTDQRSIIGAILDAASTSEVALRIGLQAFLHSIDGYWWQAKFRYFEADVALPELLSFAVDELSKPTQPGKRRDPLACVRTNATNRSLSSLWTGERRAKRQTLTNQVDERPEVDRQQKCLTNSFMFLTSEISSVAGCEHTSAASFVLHRGYGVSLQQLANVSKHSKATHHRRSTEVEAKLRASNWSA